MAFARTSALAIIEDNGQFLFVQETKPHVAGKYCLPGGGIEAGESPEAAIQREVHEETGLEVRPVTLSNVFYRYKADRGANVIFVYECRIVGGELTTSVEHPDLLWLSLSDVERYHNGELLRNRHLFSILQGHKSVEPQAMVATLFD